MQRDRPAGAIAPCVFCNAAKMSQGLTKTPARGRGFRDQTWRSTIIFLIDAIAFAGFNPFGQVLVQFMIVWQR